MSSDEKISFVGQICNFTRLIAKSPYPSLNILYRVLVGFIEDEECLEV
jgi:hypothetical protein